MNILNLGAGPKKMPGAVNVDVNPDFKPDVVFNLDTPKRWSFAKNNTFDIVYAQSILEHVFHFKEFIRECHHVLRPGGKLYLDVPFFYHYHPTPTDYWRFTKPCLARLLSQFSVVNINEFGGRSSSLLQILFPTKCKSLRNMVYPLLERLDKLVPHTHKFAQGYRLEATK